MSISTFTWIQNQIITLFGNGDKINQAALLKTKELNLTYNSKCSSERSCIFGKIYKSRRQAWIVYMNIKHSQFLSAWISHVASYICKFIYDKIKWDIVLNYTQLRVNCKIYVKENERKLENKAHFFLFPFQKIKGFANKEVKV